MTIKENKIWYAAYTKSRSEKKVLIELEALGIEAYLPLQKKLRQWSDRKKWVEMPLIPGYIFVYINKIEYYKVLDVFGIVSYVRFEGKPATIPENQIDTIKLFLRQKEIEIDVSFEKFISGDAVEVIGGPLIGLYGQLITIKGKKRVTVQLKNLNLSLNVELPLTDIKKI